MPRQRRWQTDDAGVQNAIGFRSVVTWCAGFPKCLARFKWAEKTVLRQFVWAWAVVFLSHWSALAAAERLQASEATATTNRGPLPIEDDANLHDVQFINSQRGWAVGDQGVVWHSADGGKTWSLQSSGVNCPLRSVCFLDDQVGWVAGGGTMPFTRASYGVILKTIDGGQTWRPIVAPSAAIAQQAGRGKTSAVPTPAKSVTARVILPRIRKIQFFSPEEGVVVGEGMGSDPSGAYSTKDGGSSWQPLPGKASPGWLAAAFLHPDAGILVGMLGNRALAIEGKIVAPRFDRSGIRGLYDVVLDDERGGWLVGDGGLVLQTTNSGIVWQAPATPLPDGIRQVFDFRTVCCRDKMVWIAGQPGSAIWHSPDAGKSWQKQKTGQSVPLARLFFGSDKLGWGVGALGTVIRTDDGGQTWQSVRGAGRRLALLALYGRMPEVSLSLIAELSAEDGYRSLVAVVAREDDSQVGGSDAESSARFDDGVIAAGGSTGQMGWQLPLAIPGLERDFDRLVADWNRRTENRLDEILSGALVRQIRTWRPSVLIIQQPETGNALASLVSQAAMKAVEQANDSTRFLEQQELAGLEPWQVQKVFVRLPPGSTGHVNVEPFRYLPRLRKMTNQVASTAEGLFRGPTDRKPVREAYRLVRSQWDEKQPPTFAGGLFSGISIPTNSAARRAVGVFDDSDLEARRKIAQEQRNFAAISERDLDDNRKAGQLIAHLQRVVRGLTPAEAAWQLTHLIEQYDAAGQWELAELTLIELVEKYPDQPAALRGMQRLVQQWGSGEVTWRRLRKSPIEQRRELNRPDVSAQAAIELVEARLQKQARHANRTIFDSNDDESTKPPDRDSNSSQNTLMEGDFVREGGVIHKDVDQKYRFWQTRALKMAAELARRDPALAAEPSVQFPLAAVYRQRTAILKSDEIYRKFVLYDTGTPWSQAAEGELWLTNPIRPPMGPTASCGFTSRRPFLDGVLADVCWQEAAEIPLVASVKDRQDANLHTMAMLCYDTEYLYFAASLPRVKGVRTDGPVEGDRRHDEDLADFDRVVLSLDIDRDYVTYFNFVIDQRGCTAESCWNDPTWNPRWFVAVAGDKTNWRLEAAIPLNELSPILPQAGAGWALGITRITPAIGLETWAHPAAATPRPETFGIMRFDAPKSSR